jgi:hypothetical protein
MPNNRTPCASGIAAAKNRAAPLALNSGHVHAKNVPLVTCTNFLDVVDANAPRSASASNAFTHTNAPIVVSALAATSRGVSSTEATNCATASKTIGADARASIARRRARERRRARAPRVSPRDGAARAREARVVARMRAGTVRRALTPHSRARAPTRRSNAREGVERDVRRASSALERRARREARRARTVFTAAADRDDRPTDDERRRRRRDAQV